MKKSEIGKLGIAFTISGEATPEKIEIEKKKIIKSIILSILVGELIHFDIRERNRELIIEGFMWTEIVPYLSKLDTRKIIIKYPFINNII